MENFLKDKLMKELAEKAEYDVQGFVRIKNFNSIVDAVENTIVKHYKDRLRNLAQISKKFIWNASQIYRGNSIESACLKEELQALEYAINLAEENFND